jgi:hypothetical protein
MKENKTIHSLFDFFDNLQFRGDFNTAYVRDEFEYQKQLMEFNDSRNGNRENIVIEINASGMPPPPADHIRIDPRQLSYKEYLHIIIEREINTLLPEIENRFFAIPNTDEKSTFLKSIENKITYLEEQNWGTDIEDPIFKFWLDALHRRFLTRFEKDILTFNKANSNSGVKIKFGSSRIELSVLFYLLFKANFFDKGVKPYRIAKLLEQNFEYKSGADYLPMKDIQDVFSKIKLNNSEIKAPLAVIKEKIKNAIDNLESE